MPQHPQTPSRHDNPTSIDDLLTHAEQTVRDMTLRDPLPAPSPPARDARLRYDTPRHHEAHLRLREHLAAWPALADATHRLLIDLDRRDDAPHLLLTALTSLQHLPQLDAPEPYLVRATTLLHAAADLAHGRDTPAAAISERTGHICGRALAMLDTAVHATQTLGAESTRPNRKNQLLARPTTPELRALRTLTQLRTQIADISPYYGRADHAGIDALAVDAHSPGLAGDLRRWHDSAIAQLTARDTPSLRLPAGDLTMITVASARLVDIAAAAGIITAQTATPASTALRAAATEAPQV